MAEYFWYAGYGSNLDRSRFYHYIKGGVFKVTGRRHTGCQDHSLPKMESTCSINHEIYFAKKSPSWENKAVAFITTGKNKKYATKCVLYLITREQFIDVLIQENGSKPPMPGIAPNFEAAKRGEETMVGKANEFKWYGRLLYLGEHDGYPIYSFTSKVQDEFIEIANPGAKYLQLIGIGLMENFEMSKTDAAAYLMQLRGVANSQWTIEQIVNLLTEPHEY